VGEPTTSGAIEAPDRNAFVERYGPLLEHSPWVAHYAWDRRPFHDHDLLRVPIHRVVEQHDDRHDVLACEVSTLERG
jgi:2-oxo-4-hydroxy-4-carboxy--5-ureidoimidazoline (OHCU) decarboxylase